MAQQKANAEPAWAPDDTEARTHHRLAGLEPDNLLAFMALLGLLRALEEARPDWRPRAFWDVDTHPWRPVLTLGEGQTEAAVAEAAAEGVKSLGASHRFADDERDLKFTADDFGKLYLDGDERRRMVLDALMCDGAVKDDGTLWPTPFCLLFGQGHQHFLDRFHDVPFGVLPEKLKQLKSPPDLGSSCYLATALFIPWQRGDQTDGFRWDFVEDRRYALRAGDPSKDSAKTQHGANRLAAIALPMLPAFAVRRRGEARCLAAATRYGPDGQITFTWPLWTRQAALTGLSALLAHPTLADEAGDPQSISGIGVKAVMRARRISVGKFFCMTRAERMA